MGPPTIDRGAGAAPPPMMNNVAPPTPGTPLPESSVTAAQVDDVANPQGPAPTPIAPEDPPTPSNPVVAQAMDDAAQNTRKQIQTVGRASTILTSMRGASGPPTISRRVLLGN